MGREEKGRGNGSEIEDGRESPRFSASIYHGSR